MNEQMDCLKFGAHLDEWIDGELSADMAQAMEAHVRECPDCAEAARLARETVEFIRSLEDEVPVPLQTQAAWRSAVREEAAKQKQHGKIRRFPAALRTVGGIAAAFVVLAGCTAVFRSTGMLNPTQQAAQPMVATLEAGNADASSRSMDGIAQQPKARSQTAPVYVASDGNEDIQSRAVEPESASADEILPVVTPQPLLIRRAERAIATDNFDGACQNIRDLTEQYGGYLASDATATAENGLRTGEIAAVIPALEADSFLQTIDLVGNVTYTAEHFEDASDNARDVQTRLDALRAEQERLNELIPDAENAEELSRLSALLQAALSEIDSLSSEANRLQSELDNVRVTIRIEELSVSSTASPTAEPALTERMGSAFHQSAGNLRSFFRDMAVSLMVIAPFLVIALPVILVIAAVVVVVRKRRKNS